ncbi:acyl--CoA ligase [Horticoccus luteus]|uniref:Acyl--CoA ligase n=1 Tax=Horticoccus luteus TaxID=2862869 RepID=A0A8F9TV25_9BACT|nr:class I adenylate-forming enzyme family protein [Horticoccus luteus]QYM79605.1 acyl--CoA ligase [Horticoccus luteus]
MSCPLLSAWSATLAAAPAAPILIDAASERTWTRAELDTAAREWVAAHGADLRGQAVVFALPNGIEWLTVTLGVLMAGGIVVSLDPGEPAAAQRTIAAAVNATHWWHDRQLITLAPRRSSPRDGRCLIKLTSGSTGTPKALPFTAAQLLADGRQICASMDIRATDLNLGCIPFGHSYGLGNLIVPLLAQGTAIVCGAPVLPQALADAIARWQPTVFPAVPALLRALAASDIAPAQLHSLRTVISAGAALSPEIAQAFATRFARRVHSFYGSSETGGIAYDRTGDAASTGRSVGPPIDGVQLTFTRGQRFFVASAAVGGRGRFRPADRAELNAHGELVLLGRAGRMLKLAGRRVDPAEIEHALRSLPDVRDAWVTLHPERPDSLAAAVCGDGTSDALRAALAERLAAWKLPRRLLVLSEFPVTARGKTDTRRLRDLLAHRPAPPIS